MDASKATDAAKEAVRKLPSSRDLKMVLASQQADMARRSSALKDVRAMLNRRCQRRE